MSWDRMTRTKSQGGLGFRDMRIFNQALLAKQAWRLVQRPDSMCARVLKSKYYPKGNIMDTVFPSDASLVWRGIERGLELLKKGMIWRVGNGKSIQILRHNWIPRQEGMTIMSLKNRSRIRWVNQLIIPNTNEWNRPLIHSLFYEFDALEICKIRIPSSPVGDVLAWNHEKDGNFTLRSAYKLGLNLKNGTGWEESSHSHGNGRVSL